MTKNERIAKTWVPLTCSPEKYPWPLDADHFGGDVAEYVKRLKEFVFEVDEEGTGVWSMGLHQGTLKVAPGSEGGHFDAWKGEMLVTAENNCVGTENWTAKLRMFLVPGENGDVCKIIWNWNNGPCKDKAVVTYWVAKVVHKQGCCSMM